MDAKDSGKLERLLAQYDRLREQCNKLHAQHAELVQHTASAKYVIIEGSKYYLLEPTPGNPDRLIVAKTLTQEAAADASERNHARPPKAAIAALKNDPALAPAFDAKFGNGTAGAYLGSGEIADLLRELIRETKQNRDLLDELVDYVAAKKRVVRDAEGEIVGVEAVDEDE